MEDFKNYYKFPLHYDGYCYIFTADYHPAFNCFATNKDAQTIVDILNGTLQKKCNAVYKDGYIFIDDMKRLLIRGWGMLTGVGGYKLDSKTATEIQDKFGKWCADELSRDKSTNNQ